MRHSSTKQNCFERYTRWCAILCLLIGGLLPILTSAQVSGTVFRDFNGNGARDTDDLGVASLTITAYFSGTSTSVVSNTAGAYAFTAAQIPNTAKVRLEFSGASNGDFSGPFSAAAAGNGTSVQFVTAGAAAININFAVNLPGDYCQPNPKWVTGCYVNGLATGTDAALVSQNYTASGFASSVPYTKVSTTADIGSTWGLAYAKQSKRLFATTYLKRHVGMADGPGFIYYFDFTAGTPAASAGKFDLQGVTPANGGPAIDLGTVCRSASCTVTGGTSASFVLGAKGAQNIDYDAFTKVGTISYGDADIDEKTGKLWVVNLFQKALISVDVSGGTLPGVVNQYPLSGLPGFPACTSGSARPFALAFHKGLGYVGIVCDAGTSQNKADLHGYVFSFDPANPAAGLTNVLDFNLGYKLLTQIGGYSWNPWLVTTINGSILPQPMLTDIEFTPDNAMIIGLRDRWGDQQGPGNLHPDGTTAVNSIAAGDILKACYNNGAWIMEGLPGGCPVTATAGGTGVNGNGEFFKDTRADTWDEGAEGGLALLPGTGEVVTTFIDPFAGGTPPNSGAYLNGQGLQYFSTNTGAITRFYQVYSLYSPFLPLFGKAEGLSDVQFLCDVAPIEIGNRVWKDDNRNGIQDPAEAGISGVTVTLYKSTTLLATAVTNTDGEYYFSSGTGTNTAAAIYSLTALAPGNTLQLRINGAQTALASLSLSPANQGSKDAIDSDFAPGAPGSATVVANVTLGVNGQNVHTFDAGLFACPTITFTAPASATTTVCANTTLNMSVTSNAVAPDSIQFVYFTSPLTSAADAYTSTEGIVLGTVASTSVTGTKTVTLSNVRLPSNVSGTNDTLTVYALLVSSDGTCRPVAQRTLILRSQPVATIVGEDVACVGKPNSLSSLDPATTYKWFVGNSPTVVSTAQVYSPTVSSTTTYHLLISDASGCVSDTADFTVNAVVCNPCVAGPGKIGGNTFRDFNGNGVKDTGEKGVAGLTVTIFACSPTGSSTLVATTTTDLNGDYFVSGLTDGKPYRVEFSSLPAGFEPTAKGTNNGTTVQFVTSPTCGVSLGLNEPDGYCQPNPRLATPCYVSGDASATAPIDVLVSFNYTAPTTPAKQTVANKAQIGSVWGLAYSGLRQKLYTGAFLKRHVALGPNGLGAIYSSNVSGAANASLFVTIPNAGTIASNAARNLTTPATPSFDPTAFAKIGTVGLGDVDISDDEKTLYAVNLNDKKIYIVDVNTQTITNSVSVPDPGCSATGDYHPFALAYRRGKLYVGITCDASVSNQTADLKSFVYEMNVTTNVFSPAPVLTIPLNYPKAYAWGQPAKGLSGEVIQTHSSRWHPWASVFSSVVFDGVVVSNTNGVNTYVSHPQPMLSDIDFDETGAMILGFIDRTGHQLGDFNADPNDATKRVNAIVGGDILRAGQCTPGVWTLENGGAICGGTASIKQTNGAGPGGGEFYYGEQLVPAHLETAQGGLAVLPGSGEVATVAMDPVTYYSGGVIRLSNKNGSQSRAGYTVYTGGRAAGLFSKANGLGDLEILCDPAPIQIGNRVWRDDNRDGIQDPCEPPIVGAVVKLYDAAKTTVLASVTTNAAGEYYFSSTTITTGNSTSSVATTALTYNTTYGLAITSLGTGTAVTGLSLTDVSPVTPGESGTINSGLTNNNNDARVNVVGGIASPCIKLTTSGPGESNHTYDFGIVKNTCSLTATASVSGSGTVCAGQPVTLTAQATPVGSYTYAWSAPMGVTLTGASTATAIATNLPTGLTTFTVTVNSSPACSTTATVSVLVNPLPVLSVQTICAPNAQTYSIVGTVSPTSATVTDLDRIVVRNADSFTIAGILTAVSDVVRAETAEGCVTSLTVAPPICQPVCTLPVGLSVTTSCASALNGSGQLVATATSLSGTVEYRLNSAGSFGSSGTFTNLSNGVYTVEARLVGSTAPTCFVSTTAVISCVCVPPVVITQVSSTSIYAGQSVTLTAQATPVSSYTYAWSGPGTITPTNASAVTASGLPGGVSTFTVTVTSSPGCSTTATVSVTVLIPALAVVVSTPVCNTLTNNYTASGTVSLTNTPAGSLTITDNGTTIATITVTTGQTSAVFTVTGVSGSSPASHTVVATLGTATASTTYATPASCTVCSLIITTSSLPNGQVGTAYNQTITTTGGTAPLAFAVSAGALPAGLALNPTTGIISGTPTAPGTASFTISVTDSKSCLVLVPLTIITSSAPVCSLTVTATPTVCNTATNQYMVTGSVSATDAGGSQSLTVAVGITSTVVTLTGNSPVSYTLTGLNSDGLVKTVTILSSATACGTASQTYTAPASCTVISGQPELRVEKYVDKSVAQKGDVLTYTLVLRNTGTVSATSVTVTDTFGAGLTYVPNSATAPAGTTFTNGSPGTWQVPTLAAGQSLTLTFQALASEEGILYNTAEVSGGIASVCTTVPFRVCTGDSYAFELTAPEGFSSYQWYRNGTLISGATSATFIATMAGSYNISVSGVGSASACVSGSCCPFIIEEVANVPAFSFTATSPTCVGSVPQTNGTLRVTGLSSVTGLTYELTMGNSFTAGTPVTTGKTTLPANGLLSSALMPGTYWVRIYNDANCYGEATAVIVSVPCNCPPPKCAPFVVKKIIRTPAPPTPAGGGGR